MRCTAVVVAVAVAVAAAAAAFPLTAQLAMPWAAAAGSIAIEASELIATTVLPFAIVMIGLASGIAMIGFASGIMMIDLGSEIVTASFTVDFLELGYMPACRARCGDATAGEMRRRFLVLELKRSQKVSLSEMVSDKLKSKSPKKRIT